MSSDDITNNSTDKNKSKDEKEETEEKEKKPKLKFGLKFGKILMASKQENDEKKIHLLDI